MLRIIMEVQLCIGAAGFSNAEAIKSTYRNGS